MRGLVTAARDVTGAFDGSETDNASSPAPTEFEALAEQAISRRGFLERGVTFGAAAFVTGGAGLAPFAARASGGRIAFDPVAANTLDTVTVPSGYNWHVVARWGDSMWSNSTAFDHATRGTGASQELAFGDNNDGMSLFDHGGRSVLAVNNEYVNNNVMYGGAGTGKPESPDDVRKGKAGHGVSIVEIAQADGRWSIVIDSPYNRRITADSPMEITGPARGHDLMKTAADPTGTVSKGTWNNCGNGRTPWGTYLACEENFNGYFSSSNPAIEVSAEFRRYGVKPEDWGYAWATTDERFDISSHPNEPNRAGYVVEIDSLDPRSTPKKRTALGRFKHENAEVVLAANGQVVGLHGRRRARRVPLPVRQRPIPCAGRRSGPPGERQGCSRPGSPTMAAASGSSSRRQRPACRRRPRYAFIRARRRRPSRRPRWIGRSGSLPIRRTPRSIAASPTTGTAGSNRTPEATPPRSAAPIRARRTSTGRSCAGGRTEATISPADFPGICSWSPATRPSMTTTGRVRAMSTRATCSTRRTDSPSDRTGMMWSPDGRELLRQRRLRRPGQQSDAGRRSRDRSDRAVHGRATGVRGHGHHLEHRPKDPVRRHPASRRQGRQPFPRRPATPLRAPAWWPSPGTTGAMIG